MNHLSCSMIRLTFVCAFLLSLSVAAQPFPELITDRLD